MKLVETESVKVEKLRADMFKTLLHFSAVGFDPAICNSRQGYEELESFFEEDEDIHDELLIYYGVLRSMKGFQYANDMCRSLKVMEKYSILCRHLSLSIYC